MSYGKIFLYFPSRLKKKKVSPWKAIRNIGKIFVIWCKMLNFHCMCYYGTCLFENMSSLIDVLCQGFEGGATTFIGIYKDQVPVSTCKGRRCSVRRFTCSFVVARLFSSHSVMYLHNMWKSSITRMVIALVLAAHIFLHLEAKKKKNNSALGTSYMWSGTPKLKIHPPKLQ